MRRDERGETRLSAVEKAALGLLAALEALTESALIRALIRAEAQRQGVWEQALELAREEGEE